jgi:hypothetical protein
VHIQAAAEAGGAIMAKEGTDTETEVRKDGQGAEVGIVRIGINKTAGRSNDIIQLLLSRPLQFVLRIEILRNL